MNDETRRRWSAASFWQKPCLGQGVPPYGKLRNEPKKFFRINKSSWNEPENCAQMRKDEPKKSFRMSEARVRTHANEERTQRLASALARVTCEPVGPVFQKEGYTPGESGSFPICRRQKQETGNWKLAESKPRQ